MIARLDLLRHELRLAARSLSRNAVFVITTVLSLALGIGASSAAFSVLDAVRFRALPFPHGERLVVIQEVPAALNGVPAACLTGCDPSYETFAQVLREHPFHSLEAVAGFTSGAKGLVLGDEIVPVLGGVVSPNLFALLNARPSIGRTFTAEDDRLGAPPMVVLSHTMWTARFAHDPAILGKVVKLSDTRYTVIGVMPAGFEFEVASQFWLPVVPTLDPSTRPSIRNLTVVARLAPSATIATLRAELSTIAPAAQLSARGQPVSTKLVAAPLRERYVASTQSHDVIFAGIVGCVLLIAVANVATLLLVRTMQQERELAVRTALGAGLGNLTIFLFSQQAMLVSAGAGLGILLASWLLRTLSSLAALDSIRPLGMDYRVDGGVAAFAVALALVIALVLGLVPLRIIRTMDFPRASGKHDRRRRATARQGPTLVRRRRNGVRGRAARWRGADGDDGAPPNAAGRRFRCRPPHPGHTQLSAQLAGEGNVSPGVGADTRRARNAAWRGLGRDARVELARRARGRGRDSPNGRVVAAASHAGTDGRGSGEPGLLRNRRHSSGGRPGIRCQRP